MNMVLGLKGHELDWACSYFMGENPPPTEQGWSIWKYQYVAGQHRWSQDWTLVGRLIETMHIGLAFQNGAWIAFTLEQEQTDTYNWDFRISYTATDPLLAVCRLFVLAHCPLGAVFLPKEIREWKRTVE